MTSTNQTQALLKVDKLTKRYRSLTAVDTLSFTLNPGDFVGFIGPNGAGKSTSMGCIAGVVNPDSGQILVDGADIAKDPIHARRLISFVPQHLELFDYLTGLEYMQLVGKLRGLDDKTRDAQIEELLELAELTEAKDRVLKEYSGGMSRKAAICAALLGPPKLLLLDESFVGLDPESTFRIRQRLMRFCDEGGAILLSSHILDMLERVCTRVIMLVDGQLKVDEPMSALKARMGEDKEFADLTELYLRTSGKLAGLEHEV